MGGLSSLIVLMENALYPFKVINAYLGRFFGRIFGGKSRSLSLAARVALAFFVCFAIFITIAITLRRCSGGLYQTHEFVEIGFLNDILFFLLAAGISILVYWGVRLATLEKPSLYPEIDRCWEPINDWRVKQALDWFDINRFLVLGTTLPVSKAMHAEMKEKKVDGMPGGEAQWMHWFGNKENLYLHLKEITHTNERLAKIKTRSSGGGFLGGDGGTLQVSVGVAGWSEEVSIGDDVGNTSSIDYGSSQDGFGRSLDPNDSADPLDDDGYADTGAGGDDEDDGDFGEDYGDDDKGTPSERIEYLARLLRAKTEGDVPFHGVIVAIPFDKFVRRENYKSISAAIKKDLLDLREYSGVAFPVSFVFTSMEKDQGFPKLQNLLGSQRAKTGRFGAGCQVVDIPTIGKKNLDLQVQRACGSFEDWVINRWSKNSQLARAAQNKELYKLVIRIRQQFQQRLRHMLNDAMIWTPMECPEGDSTDLSLAGCYFVSTGNGPVEQGFLAGLFSKCEEFAEVSSWSDSAIEKDRFYSVLSSLMVLFSLVTIIAIGVLLFMKLGG